MPMYRVTRTEYWNVTDTLTTEVEANDEDQAIELAEEEFSEGTVSRNSSEELMDSDVEAELVP